MDLIRFTLVPSELGPIGLAASRDGVCFLGFTGGEDEFRRTLADEYPKAAFERDDAGLREMVTSVLDTLQDRPASAPQLAGVGTPFQRRVWALLRAIPAGQTRTYQQLAAELGNPNAVRAVARACATNPVSLLVPCHRVIRTDGSLAGYRWGIERKRALLEREAARHVGLVTRG